MTSKDVDWTPEPAGGVAIGVAPMSIDISQAKSTNHYSHYREDFYATLVSESSGTVAANVRQPLRLSAALKFERASEPPSALFATITLFIPPLGWVPEDSGEDYSVEYLLRTRDDAVVYRRKLADKVGGSVQGWYIGRAVAFWQLGDLEAAAVAKNAARLVLKDIAEHVDALSGAAPHAPRRADAPSADAAPAASGGDAWWKKSDPAPAAPPADAGGRP